MQQIATGFSAVVVKYNTLDIELPYQRHNKLLADTHQEHNLAMVVFMLQKHINSQHCACNAKARQLMSDQASKSSSHNLVLVMDSAIKGAVDCPAK